MDEKEKCRETEEKPGRVHWNDGRGVLGLQIIFYGATWIRLDDFGWMTMAMAKQDRGRSDDHWERKRGRKGGRAEEAVAAWVNVWVGWKMTISDALLS